MDLLVSQRRRDARQHTPLHTLARAHFLNTTLEKREGGYRNKSITHASLTIDIILAQYLITLVHAFAALKTVSVSFAYMLGIEDVNATAGVFLGFSVWRVDLDGVVDSRCGDHWFVGVAFFISPVCE